MKNTVLFSLCLGLAFIAFTSCEEKTACDLTTDAPLQVGFYSLLNDTLELDTTATNFTAWGIGSTDTIYQLQSGLAEAELQLNPFIDKASYVLTFDSITDTLQVSYTRELELVSELCGFITLFDIQSIQTTRNYIDSVAIVNTKVTTDNVQHVKIYF